MLAKELLLVLVCACACACAGFVGNYWDAGLQPWNQVPWCTPTTRGHQTPAETVAGSKGGDVVSLVISFFSLSFSVSDFLGM